MQDKYVHEMMDLYAEDFNVVKIPLLTDEVRGSKKLSALGIPSPPVPAPQVDSDTFVHERLKDGCSAVSMAYVLRLYNDTFAMTADRLPLRIPW